MPKIKKKSTGKIKRRPTGDEAQARDADSLTAVNNLLKEHKGESAQLFCMPDVISNPLTRGQLAEFGEEEVKYNFKRVPDLAYFSTYYNTPDGSGTNAIPWLLGGQPYEETVSKKVLELYEETVSKKISTNLDYILLTDDRFLFQMLLFDAKFNEENKCLVLLAYVDKATSYFLRFIKYKTGALPIYAVVNFMPGSLKLLNFLNDNSNMPQKLAEVELDIKWLGLRPFSQKLSNKAVFLRMSDAQIQAAKELLALPYVYNNRELKLEVQLMISSAWMVILEGFTDHFSQYIPKLVRAFATKN